MNRSTQRIAIGLLSFIVFIALTGLVVSGAPQTYDAQAALLVNHFDLGSVGTSLMVLLTDYGREVVWGVLVVVMFLLGGKLSKLLAVELAMLFVVGILAGEVSKVLIGRTRPESLSGIILRVPAETDFGYPSGHALIVSIGAAFSLARFRRKTLAALLALEAGLVCYSRVYVGLHYPLDVLSGVLLGIVIAMVGIGLIDRFLGSILTRLVAPILLILREGPLEV